MCWAYDARASSGLLVCDNDCAGPTHLLLSGVQQEVQASSSCGVDVRRTVLNVDPNVEC